MYRALALSFYVNHTPRWAIITRQTSKQDEIRVSHA